MSPPRKLLPHNLKLELLADQEKGYGPTALMKKYKIKKSVYYRILSEKDAIRNFPGTDELTPKTETDVDGDMEEEMDVIGNGENGDVTQESKSDEIKEEMKCVTPQSLEGVNEAVMQWYNQQEADGIQVESGDIDEAAERLAQKLGFTDFKLNSSGWPLRFRKPQDIPKTPDSVVAENEETPTYKPKKFLRIQDQITAFQRLQAGESAVKIGRDLGVSKTTILRIKKKLKDTLFTSLDPNYQINVQRLKTKRKNENAPKEKVKSSEKPSFGAMSDAAQISDGNKDSVWAAIERRKQLKLGKNGASTKARSLTHDEVLEVLAQFKTGKQLKQIAMDFSVSPSVIQRVKKKFSKSHKLEYKNYMRLEQKVNVLERLDEGETTFEIAEDLGVHDTTIRSIKKSRLKIMNVYKASLASIGLKSSNQTKSKSTINDKIEERLLVWINDLKRRKMPLSNAMIRKKALMIQMSISQEEGGSSSHSFIHTKDWLNNFKKRHNIQQMLHEESESGSESDTLRFCKAAPKSKKKKYVLKSKTKVEDHSSDSQQTSLPSKDGLSLSKFAEGLREMYLSRNLPANPYRCNSFTPRVILFHMEQNTIKNKSEALSDEETWLTAHTNTCSDSDWEDNTWDTNSQVGYQFDDNSRKKRKKSTDGNNHKKRKLSDEENSDDRSVDYSDSNFISLPIKQEPLDTLDSVHSSVPMAVLPAGSSYVPPLPMFQMPSTSLTVFMPESQQMMLQHPANYSHPNSSDLYLNQQQLRARSITDSPPNQFNNIHGEASIEPNIRQDNETMIMMPFDRNISEQEKSRHLSLSCPDSSASDSLEEKEKRDRAAAIAENMEIPEEESSHIKLRDLTFKLLELNNKNMIYDQRIEKAREEYEKTVALIETEKKINDKEIDKVLASIQEWKEAKSQCNNT